MAYSRDFETERLPGTCPGCYNNVLLLTGCDLYGLLLMEVGVNPEKGDNVRMKNSVADHVTQRFSRFESLGNLDDRFLPQHLPVPDRIRDIIFNLFLSENLKCPDKGVILMLYLIINPERIHILSD